MSKALSFIEGIGNEATDFSTPTATAQHPLGKVIRVEDSDYKAVKRYMYVKAHDTLTQYGVYIIVAGGTAGAEVVTALPVDTSATKDTAFFSQACVAEVAFTSGYFGWVCIQGNTTLKTAGTVTTLHAMKLSDGAATVATESAVTVTGYTVAIAVAGRSGAGNMTAFLIGQDRPGYQYTAS